MSPFLAYLQLGFEHILDIQAYDHLAFIIAICAVYQPQDWRKLLGLVTAFTIGHSITLALAVLQIVNLPSDLIEFCIPLTIFLTAIFNLYQTRNENPTSFHYFPYLLVLFFGLIHGLGFSNYLKALLGAESEIIQPLFAFNVGIELAQILVIATCMIVLTIFLKISTFKIWRIIVSTIVALVSIHLMLK